LKKEKKTATSCCSARGDKTGVVFIGRERPSDCAGKKWQRGKTNIGIGAKGKLLLWCEKAKTVNMQGGFCICAFGDIIVLAVG